MTNLELGARIVAARQALGLTQQQLAAAVGITKSTVSRYESGSIKTVKFPVITAISDVLSVNPAWLLGRSEEREKDTPAHCGRIPILNFEGNLPIASGKFIFESELAPEAHFAMRAPDNSLDAARIEKGDLLIIRRCERAKSGDIVLLKTIGGVAIRRCVIERESICFVPQSRSELFGVLAPYACDVLGVIIGARIDFA